jgi:hypothetical protein
MKKKKDFKVLAVRVQREATRRRRQSIMLGSMHPKAGLKLTSNSPSKKLGSELRTH